MKKALIALAVLLAANALVSAKMKRFVWDDEICTHEGWYDAAKYTEKQLENTYRLWYSQDFELFAWNGERNVNGINEPFTLEWLDYQYAVKYAVLRDLKIVDTPYWQNAKKKKLRALEQRYTLERTTFEAAAGNPLVLRRLRYAGECLTKYAEPLIANFEARTASADRLKDAREEVSKSGWWNCVNSKIVPEDDEGVMQQNFRKLFRRVRELGCDYA